MVHAVSPGCQVLRSSPFRRIVQGASVPSTPQRPKLEDVAARVGLSTATVSLVLRNAPGPSAPTRERVMAAVTEMGYRPDRAASLLARRRSHLLGVLMDVRSTFHAELVSSLHEAAERVGYDVLLSTTTPNRDSRRAVETLVDSRCEALVLLGPDTSAARLTTLGEQLPVVVVGRRLRSPSVDVVRSADAKGVAVAVDHLQGLGHRRIAFVDGGSGAIATDRRSGYLRAMRRHHLEYATLVLPGDVSEQAGAEAAARLLAASPAPTAVVAFNDRVALGLITRLLRSGVAVPAQVSVVGYDDSPSAQLPHVDLTSVSQNAHAQAEHAVAAAVERLDGDRRVRREVVLEPHLVVRRSTAAPRTGARLAVNGEAGSSTAP